MTNSRRQFLKIITSAAGVPVLLCATSKAAPLPLAFSTLGCPKWDWRTILGRARQYGYAAIELRGIQDELDLTKCPEFSKAQLEVTKSTHRHPGEFPRKLRAAVCGPWPTLPRGQARS